MKAQSQYRKKGADPGAMLFLLFVLVLTLFAVISKGAAAPTGDEGVSKGDSAETLLFVRKWNPKDGELVGWLPLHQAAIDLEYIDKVPSDVHFDLNQAVKVIWVPHRITSPSNGQVLISPHSQVIGGKHYVPVERDGNMVRIGKFHFLIRRVIFGECIWRRASKPPVDSVADAGN